MILAPDAPLTNAERAASWRVRYLRAGFIPNTTAARSQRLRRIDWSRRDERGRLRMGYDGFLPRRPLPDVVIDYLSKIRRTA